MIRGLVLLIACWALGACSGPTAALPGPLAAQPASAVTAASGRPHAISEFVVRARGVAHTVPFQIAAGSDGGMWFTEQAGNAVGHIDAAGVIKQFPLPTADALPEGIAAGPDGALYIAETFGPSAYDSHIARMTTRGVFREWNDDNYMPLGVAAGSNGQMWFTQGCAGIALVSGGTVRQFNTQGISAETTAIVQGPDGAMWFAADGTATIGRVTASGAFTFYAGIGGQGNDLPHGVTVGSDGNLWWTALDSNLIWATDMHGRVVHTYAIPTAGSAPWGIVAGRDGALWFTEWSGNKIGRVTTDGAFSEYPIPTPKAHPQGLAIGKSGIIWFTESGANKIGRIVP
jgi:virginiamycin B lyase